MQNNKARIAATGLVLSGLMRACASTNPKPAISSNMDPALPALSCSWQTDYVAVLAVASCSSAKSACCLRQAPV